MKKVVMGVGVMAFLPMMAFGQNLGVDIAVPGVTINESGVAVTNDGADISVSEAGVDIQTPDAAVQVSESVGVQVETEAVVVSVPTAEVNVNVQSETNLSTLVETNTVTENTAEMLLEIDASDEVLIQTAADTKVYAQIVTDSNVAVQNVTVSDNEVRVTYQETGKVFGVFSAAYDADVVVTNDGSVSIDGPWYSFLVFGKNRNEVETAVEAGVLNVDVSVENTSFLQARFIDIVAGSVRLLVGADGSTAVSVESDTEAAVSVDGDAVEVRGQNGAQIKIDTDRINISI